jgi:uncharacterized iron-regulated membrane protein
MARKENNKKLWAIHSWVGLYAGIVIAVLSITGAAAVFIPEIDVLLNREMLEVKPEEKKASLNAIMQKVKAKYPALELNAIELPASPEQVYVFKLFNPEAGKYESRSLDVQVNPYTGEITGTRDYNRSFAFFLRHLHVRLYENYWGRQVVGLFGIALVISTITGLLIYGNFMKKQFFGSFRSGRGIRIASADWHKFVGVAALLFNLIIAITGAWLGLQPKVMSWTGMKSPNHYVAPEKPITQDEDKTFLIDYDALLHKAQQAYPEMLPLYVTHSDNGTRQVEIYGNIAGQVYERQTQKLVLDKQTHEVKFLYDVRKQDIGDKLYYVQEALHFGDFGGLFLKILYCLFGLTSGALSITGYIIYLKRKEKQPGNVKVMQPKPLKIYAKNYL